MTAKMLEIASCVPLAVTSGGADTSRKSDTGVQKSANWIHPPTTDSDAEHDNGHEHHQRPFARPPPGPAWWCSRAYALGSPQKTRKSMRNV